jgi:antirestriction protein ArdC
LIAKQVALRSARKGDFADLVRYLTDAQGKVQRVGHVVVTNCTSDNPLDAAIEVRLTQQQNTRSAADKTYHLIVSFRVSEHPSAEVLRAIEQRLCEGLGFGDHQRVSASHHDTDNLHVHVAINKVHPTRYTVHAPYYDHTTLGKLCEELETTYGLQTDNHAAQQRGAQSRAVEMEHHTGVESLVGWVQRECLDRVQGASSWAELHDTLLEHGLELKTRANGFVFTDREGHHAKASSVDRSLSKPRLEKRLGPFEPSVHSPEDPLITARSRYEKKPLPFKVDTTALYVRYQQEKEHSAQARAAEMTVLRQRQSAELEQLRRMGGFQHAAIKLLGGDRLTKKALYALTAHARKNDLAQLREQHRRERHFLRQQFARKAWTDWLRAQTLSGDPGALRALQAQRTEHGRPEDSSSVVPHHVGRAAIRDDGRRLHVFHGADQSTVDAALRIAVERYGQRLHVAGSDEFKTRVVAAATRAAFPVTFADAALEQRRPTFSPTASQEPINAIFLMAQGHDDLRWMTYRQAEAAGAQVRKGERGTPIQYWKFEDDVLKVDAQGQPVRNAQGEQETQRVRLERPRVFHATVFNATQIDGLLPIQRPEPSEQRWSAIERAEAILAASGATIRHESGNRAFYRTTTDSIHLPQPGQFASADNYYATALHELGHWTGHASRLGRDLSHPFGSEAYAKEELRAEIASLILGDELGIGHDPGQHAAYVKSWIAVLENDPLEIVRAAADAEKIQRFVMSFEQVQQQAQEMKQVPEQVQVAFQSMPAH